MIDEALAQRALNAALESGADFAELFFEDSETTRIELTDGSVNEAAYARLCGAGIRVLYGTQSAYAYTSDPEEAKLLETARAAAAAIRGGTPGRAGGFTQRAYATPMALPFSSVDNARRIALIRDAARAAADESGEVTQVVASYMDKLQRVRIWNSEGLAVSDERPRTRCMLRAVAVAGGEAQTGHDGAGCCRGFEAYADSADLEAAGRRAAKTAVTMLHAPECPAGRMPVVIDGGFGGVIFHEACGHSLEATSVGRGNSEFCGKLGERIAAPCVSAVDDGTLPGEWGSINVDDEGAPPQRNLLIENGVLKGYLIDRLGARRMGMPATGSARRQGYGFAPTSRMTNTFICAGEDDEEEMLRTMGEGLFASRMGGGSVNPSTGEFNFSVSEGYWVRDGRIAHPVRGATLIGRGGEVLKAIDRVGRRVWLEQGMCGSLSGSVPTNVGQPRIRVSILTVGGKGGAL
ncbi:MAG: TldD/PmbA family protein [Clostridia bacterium]|nr:TldD/PmbA family protein [Clostridia bacterium]